MYQLEEYLKSCLVLIKKENYCLLENDLNDNIMITGYLESDKVGNYFKLSDAALLLYKNGISVRNGSMLAAYQENIPVITSKSEIIDDFFEQENFLLINNDVDSVYNAILDLQNGKIKPHEIKIEVSWKSIAKEHINVYEKIKL